MIKLSVAVMAHPSREKFVSQLVKRLDATPRVVWDSGNDRWDTGKRALLAHNPDATHHLVLQDDAVVCSQLVGGLQHLLQHVPADNPVSLFLGQIRPGHPQRSNVSAQIMQSTRTKRAKRSWIVMAGPWWGVGVCLPTPSILPAVVWGDSRPDIEAYDRKLSRFFGAHKLDCWYTVPSLVDHRVGHRSLIHVRYAQIRAQQFVGQANTPHSIDWTRR